MMEEIWKSVKGYEGIYEISNLGRLKALESVLPHYKSGTMVRKEKLLKTDKAHGNGYVNAYLSKNKVRFTTGIHRLVAIAFIENPNNLPEVNHKDTIKTNNIVSNLEWCDGDRNREHAAQMGLNVILKGEQHGHSKLTEAQVLEIRKAYDRKSRNGTKLAKSYGVSKVVISAIVTRRSWRHI